MAVNMTITPGADSFGPADSILSVCNKRPFSYTFTPTVPFDLFQASGTASSDFDLQTGVFSNPNGYSPPGATYSLIVDALDNIQTATSVFIAGSTAGYADGTGSGAQFDVPSGIAMDSTGNMYISDTNNQVIRKVTQSGVVTTLAGIVDIPGYADGLGVGAQFNVPGAMAIDSLGTLYVIDTQNLCIRRITSAGIVSTIAGPTTLIPPPRPPPGYVDASNGPDARFAFEYGTLHSIAIASDSNIYVSDYYTSGTGPIATIRKITPSGAVSTIYSRIDGSPILGLGADASGFLYAYIESSPSSLIRINLTTNAVTTLFTNISRITSIAFDIYGNMFTIGVSGLNRIKNSTIIPELPSASARQIATFNGQVYAASFLDSRVYNYNVQIELAPNRSRPNGYAIIATSGSLVVNTISRILSTETPTIVGNAGQLYKYEPFAYEYSAFLSGDSLTLNTTPEILAFTSSNSSNVFFSSEPGYQTSYLNAFPFTLQLLSNSTVVESKNYTFQIGPGRFYSPPSNSSYTLYLNEAFTLPLDTCASLTQVFSTPSLPAGLSFGQVDLDGYVWRIQGSPTVRTVPTTYQIFGRNNLDGKVVSTSLILGVSGERVQLFVNDISNFPNQPIYISNMKDGIPITSQQITATFPGAPAFNYQWFPSLPNGINFLNSSGTIVTTPFFPSDPSSTIVLSGTPTTSALKTLAATNTSNYVSTLVGTQLRPGAPISNAIPFVFSFQESVLFTADPYFKTQYIGVPLTVSDNVVFEANTYFNNNTPITNIFSPDLRSDLSISFNALTQKAYLVSPTGPVTASTNTFTLRAVNQNSITRDASLTITTIPDEVIWNYSITPQYDTSYSFIFSRASSNGKTGYYPSLIQFSAVSESGQPVTYSTSDFVGTGLFLSNGILTGTPSNVVTPEVTAVITATAANTGASSTTQVLYSILDDVITFSSNLPVNFFQNVALPRTQISGTTLSGRTITLFTISNAPPGIFMTPTGLMTGIPSSDTSGTYSVTATTGYKTQTIAVDYSLTPDAVVFIVDPLRYFVPPGTTVPPISYTAISYSGQPVRNFAIDTSSVPTTFGVTLSTNGVFNGTMSTCVPPNPIVPDYPQLVEFTVDTSVGILSASTQFIISSLNGNGPRRYLSLQTPGNGNVLYYTIPASISNVPAVTEFNNFTEWRPANINLPVGSWANNVVTTSVGDTATVLIARSPTSNYIYYSEDGITFSESTVLDDLIITDIATFNGTWYGVGVVSPFVFLIESADAKTWAVSNASVIDDGITQLVPRSGTTTAYESNGFAITIDQSTGYIWVGGGNGEMVTSNAGVTWERMDGGFLSGEVAGIYANDSSIVSYGSEYFSTSSNPATFIPSPTMVGDFGNNAPFPIPGEFNFFCYSLVASPAKDLFLATGIHNYGSGYIPELRASTSLFGPYTVVDLSTNAPFSATATPVKPPIGIGPVFFDETSLHVMVSREISPGSNVIDLYIHDKTFPLTDWLIKPNINILGISNAEITSISEDAPFVVDENCLPFLDFTPGGDIENPPAKPVFTLPVQTEFIEYQYLAITPFTVSAVPSVGSGSIYIFADPNDLNFGLQFNQFTRTVSGIPTKIGPQTMRLYALDTSTQGIQTLVLKFNILVPRVIRKQDGAGAYTALLRNYTEVNAAQNARDTRVFAGATQTLGMFSSPDAPDVISAPVVNPKCCNPNT